jgi:hypothetical protein
MNAAVLFQSRHGWALSNRRASSFPATTGAFRQHGPKRSSSATGEAGEIEQHNEGDQENWGQAALQASQPH